MNVTTVRRRLAAACRITSQADVARRIGVAPSFINGFVKGRKPLPGHKVLDWLGLEAVVTYRRRRPEPPPSAAVDEALAGYNGMQNASDRV